jgi:hypothetical protein
MCEIGIADGGSRVECSCGEIYCGACISMFSGEEFDRVETEAAARGHILDKTNLV